MVEGLIRMLCRELYFPGIQPLTACDEVQRGACFEPAELLLVHGVLEFDRFAASVVVLYCEHDV